MSSISRSVGIKRVPIEEERQQLVTELVFTIAISPHQTAQVLKFIGQRLPKLSGIEHVKRVKKHPDGGLLVIMCQCSQISREALSIELQGTEWETLEVAEHAVPTVAPYTAEQYDLWKAVWPVSYRPPVIVRTVLSPDDREYIERILRYVADSMSTDDEDVVVAICSPHTRLIIAETTVSQASRKVHPLEHAAMCCIAQVAGAELRRQESASDVLPAKRPHSPSAVDDDSNGDYVAGYLCEGLDVFASREPCVMCTMALVHSRIGRLFFLAASPSGGGISRYSMHSYKSLNHHFSAFQCSITSTDKI
ncbi:tRNA-specific adenosine deaminase subunit tad3 [Coemansia aciculifera]|uniref:tRNA-specific adenosine deaminase subunit tad3 n=1 Tax=Coemansia aciculifera TaxID=417176 RepID=A0A9W8IGT6_9FUNG|nr:tRNA-specific adenosine deaminase subunit tad3 [Coemansia aciculifera]KAJ2870784.1 tRNA-specific adenosine deaminase subunit tad3 [Coemansia aciculifera]